MLATTRRCLNQAMTVSLAPRLAGKVCIVSGGSRGIGQGIITRFAEEGAMVASISPDSHDETAEQIARIEGLPRSVADTFLAFEGDVSSEADCTAFAKSVRAKFGPAAVLVNNACRFVFASVEHATPEMWDQSTAVNVKGHALLTKAVLPHMKSRGSGSIVFLGSISSYRGQPNCATYATMKGAVAQMARSCAYDFAKYHVRVNTLLPGAIETPISQVERDTQGWTYEEWEKLKTHDVIMRRVGTVREVANAALFFASDESSYCTGAEIYVDGGQAACTVMLD
ncbi:2-(R)-hydroxypropyl-CoM dehydrogenase [Diplonema papillatum]|nr:2-(R)-hydroxypropyl-CoM dehydrogenase [Diplonema papillatum]